MASQSDTATGTSEESATESEVTKATGGFAAELLKVAAEIGHEVGASPARSEQETEQEEEQTEEQAGESETNEEEEQEQETAEATEDEEESEEDESESKVAAKTRQEWPDDAKARIADETSKRKRRTEERDKALERAKQAEARAQALEARLIQASRPQPTATDPLADVHNEQSLQQAEAQIEEVLAFAEKHRDGAEGVVIGKDANGKEIVQDFTPEQIADIKIAAERRLRKDIPQRRALLVQRAQYDAEAVDFYKDFNDPESKLSQEAAEYIRSMPEILRFPDALLSIGDFIAGRKARLAKAKAAKNGKSGNGAVDLIVESSKTKLAPSATKSRAFGSTDRRGADVERARKRFKEEPDEDSAADYVGAILQGNSRSKTGRVA